MAKHIFPPEGTILHRFLNAMRTGTMDLHQEFVQAVGNRRLKHYADELLAMGWDVQVILLPAPGREAPKMRVALYYLGDASYTVDAAVGDRED